MSSERPRAIGNKHVSVPGQSNVVKSSMFFHLVEITRYH